MLWQDTPRELVPADLHRSAIGERYWGVSLSAIPPVATYRDQLCKYLNSLKDALAEGYGLLLVGDFRQGKTGAAIVVAKAALAHGATVMFMKADSVQGNFLEGKEFNEDQTIFERSCLVDLFILDDLGAEVVKDFGASLFERLIRARYDRKKSTIITTNLSSDVLRAKYPAMYPILQSTLLAIPCAGVDWFRQEKERAQLFFSRKEST